MQSAWQREPERTHYVDAIRGGAIALVFLVHVAEVFNPWDEWHISNAERSRAIGEIAVFAAPWVMPLVMLLAGFGAWHSLRHRDNSTYVRDRVLRVALPAVVGTLLLVTPQVYLERRLDGQFNGSFFAFLPHFFDGIYPRGNLSWHHLWFLAHLFVYSIVALPLFRRWQRKGAGRSLRWAARLSRAPGGLLWLSIPLILERNLLWGLFPERHMLTSDWSNHALLFVAYLYGFVLAGSRWLSRSIDDQWPRVLVVAIVGTSCLMIGAWNGFLPGRVPPPYSLLYLAFWTLYAVCAWAWMVALLGIGRKWLRADSPLVRYGRRVGYTFYMVHQPIIVGVASVIVQTRLSVPAKFALTLTISMVVTVVCVEALSTMFARGRSLIALVRRQPRLSLPESRHRRTPDVRWGIHR